MKLYPYENNLHLDQILKVISTLSLTSLSIDFSEHILLDKKQLQRYPSWTLRELCLNCDDIIIKLISFPNRLTFIHFSTSHCTDVICLAILQNCPHLRTFVTKYIEDYSNETNLSFYTCTNNSRLTYLTLNDCHLSMENLETLLSFTPSLVNLKLVSCRSTVDFIFAGTFWEKLIQTKLPLLDKFEFFLQSDNIQDICRIESLITQFKTSFWLNDKRWFVNCDYVIPSSPIRIYTNYRNYCNYVYSGHNVIYRVTNYCENELINTQTQKVRMKFSQKKIP